MKKLIVILALGLALTACGSAVEDGFNDLVGRDDPSDIGDDPPDFDSSGVYDADGACFDQDGKPFPIPPTTATIAQSGSSLDMRVDRSGKHHKGRVSGNRFYVSSSVTTLGVTCDYEFYGDVLSANELIGDEKVDCDGGLSVSCPNTHLTRIQ